MKTLGNALIWIGVLLFVIALLSLGGTLISGYSERADVRAFFMCGLAALFSCCLTCIGIAFHVIEARS